MLKDLFVDWRQTGGYCDVISTSITVQ